MGHNISPIANHNLNTVNVKTLAHDLISRLDINIEYGYYGFSEYFQLLDSKMEDDFIKLGKVTKDESFETYKLIDEKYQIKQLYEKFGDDIFYNPKYWIHFDCELPDEKTIIEEKKEVNHSIYSLELVSNKEFKYLTIYDHSFLNVIPYISKWWTFCRIFTEKYYEDKDFLLSLNDYRKELMYYTLKLGGNKIYYISDQSDVLKGVGQGDESEMNWSEFENYVFEKTSNFMLDIPNFFSEIRYRSEFHETNYFPMSFVDNFADLK